MKLLEIFSHFLKKINTSKPPIAEWVIMEDDGPGVISKIWAVCFYYALEAEYITPLAISELVIEDFAEILVSG